MELKPIHEAIAKRCIIQCINYIMEELKINEIPPEDASVIVTAVLATLICNYCTNSQVSNDKFKHYLEFLENEYVHYSETINKQKKESK